MEGQNIAIGWRFAEDKLERYPDLMAEFGHLNVEVIAKGGRHQSGRERMRPGQFHSSICYSDATRETGVCSRTTESKATAPDHLRVRALNPCETRPASSSFSWNASRNRAL